MISSERPNSIIAFLKVLSRMYPVVDAVIFLFAAFPCKLIRRMVLFNIQVLSHTCDRVAGPS